MTLSPEPNGNGRHQPTGSALNLTEDQRRTVSLWLAWTMWLATGTLILLRAAHVLPQQWGSLALLTLGAAIAASLSRGRMRLADTISQTFESGLKVATVLQTNVSASACMVEVDFDGIVESIEHPEVIGWGQDDLCGRSLDTVIPDRFLRQYQEDFRSFRDSGDTNTHAINIPITTQAGSERGMRLNVARLGDCILGTLVPIGQAVPQSPQPLGLADEGDGART